VVEGENTRGDRNEVVGNFEIHATNLKRDVPAGSELDVVIEVDDSRRFLTKAYVPMLDEEFEATLIKTLIVPKPDELEKLVQAEKKRLAELREKARKSNEARALELLVRIDGERLEHEVDQALAASRNDQDSADKCASRLRDLQIALDGVEKALQWPELVAKAEEVIKLAEEVVQKHGNVADRTLLNGSPIRAGVNK
jgi:molecular chaperone DnaK